MSLAAVLISLASLSNPHPGQAEFVAEVVAQHGLDAARVESLLAQSQRQQGILDAISRPAEAKPWHQYRPIFMTEDRIAQGVTFWNEHAELLARIEKEYGVEAEYVVAIVGVETKYGQILGRWKVLDALSTLAFHYPPRAAFFRRELGEFMALEREERVDAEAVMGSYAGAMGVGQFMPSSWRAYAVDFDGDERRDLWDSRPDALASVANYLKRHGWTHGQPVALPTRLAADAKAVAKPELKPALVLGDLRQRGYAMAPDIDDKLLVTVQEYQLEDGSELWLGFNNFYAITRYNRSPLYALAVHQLAQAIRERRE